MRNEPRATVSPARPSLTTRRVVLLLVVAFASAVLMLMAPAGRTVMAAEGGPIAYRFTFPEPHHHWMQVEASFTGLDAAPLELRASRSSPGRYSLHDFAKNVYDVQVTDAAGRDLPLSRPDPYGWTVAEHGDALTVRYKVFGDRIDGTYLAIDSTHAHINMPAAIVWARGLDERAATVTFVPPAGTSWQVATQLHPGSTPFEFTAPNLQYLMDSPSEFGAFSLRQFSVDGHRFRVALHHTGTGSELDAFARDVEKIVREEGRLFGEFPAYEPGHYTFLVDYLPYASGDGMEHRNSTVISSSLSLNPDHRELLDTVAHEFFHCWNVERIRPRSLEPFNFEAANLSGELWLAEGFTQYYAPLTLSRAGLADLPTTARTMAELISSITVGPGRTFRSAVEMSEMAAFIDGGRAIDRTNWNDTVISYYPFGGAIALALDLSLRDRSNGRTTLDDFMRAMWRAHGKPGGAREGYVDRPYTIADAEMRLAEVSGDRAFARDFFARYIQGREAADYKRLLSRAGLVLRRTNERQAWWGEVPVESSARGLRLRTAPLANTPAYAAGLDAGDEVRELAGARVATAEDLNAELRRHKPGDRVTVAYTDRAGTTRTATMTLGEDPSVEIVTVEATGAPLTPEQRAFRSAWLTAN
jgi:predicted metalloprotease with PDZ domain